VVDTGSKTITITSGDWTVTAPTLTLNGNLKVNGDIETTGNVTAGGTITDSDGDGGA
jgi:phage baseplate assembly protein gpV